METQGNFHRLRIIMPKQMVPQMKKLNIDPTPTKPDHIDLLLPDIDDNSIMSSKTASMTTD